jgi:hypothetical protein
MSRTEETTLESATQLNSAKKLAGQRTVEQDPHQT